MPEVSNLSLTGIALFTLIMLWRWQRSHPEFDLADLITGDNGKVSATKFAQTGAWVVATWGFVTMVQQGKLTEWYLAAYMGFSFGTRVIKDVMAKPTP